MDVIQEAGIKRVLTGLVLTIAIAVADWWTLSSPVIAVLYVIPVLLVARETQAGAALWIAGLASGLSLLDLFRTIGHPPMWAKMGELGPVVLALWAAAILAPPRRQEESDRPAVAPDIEGKSSGARKILLRRIETWRRCARKRCRCWRHSSSHRMMRSSA